jgi:hypothetical protein
VFYLSEIVSKEIYKKIDKERIIQALHNENWKDAAVLFKYSSLTKEEFNQIKIEQTHSAVQKEPKESQHQYIWERLLNEISKRIPAPSFETWFKNTKGGIVGDKINIFVSSSFQRDWLEERFLSLISSIAEELLGVEYKIHIILLEEN